MPRSIEPATQSGLSAAWPYAAKRLRSNTSGRRSEMNRRAFIGLIGGAATAWPFAVRAQPAARRPTIGFLGAGSPAGWSRWTAALLQRLQELGWVDGRTVSIEYRWAEGRSERYAEIAAEFVRLNVDVIVSVGSGAIVAKQVTSTIPIVFTLAADPVGDGMVASLARPAGNVTGLSIQSVDVAGKRLELLREVIPGLRRLAILAEVGNFGSALEQGQVKGCGQNDRPRSRSNRDTARG